MRVKSYPSPPFTVEMALVFLPSPNTGSYAGAGLGIRDHVSGKLQCYGILTDDYKVNGYSYPSPTGSQTAITGWPGSGYIHALETNLLWLKYEDDNTNRKISISVDGYSWSLMVSLARTDYLTPTQIGLWLRAQQTTPAQNQGATFLHWKEY